MAMRKGKLHVRTMKNGSKQKGRWLYKFKDSKKGRKWSRVR